MITLKNWYAFYLWVATKYDDTLESPALSVIASCLDLAILKLAPEFLPEDAPEEQRNAFSELVVSFVIEAGTDHGWDGESLDSYPHDELIELVLSTLHETQQN